MRRRNHLFMSAMLRKMYEWVRVRRSIRLVSAAPIRPAGILRTRTLICFWIEYQSWFFISDSLRRELARQGIVHFDFHSKQRRAVSLPLRIGLQRQCAATIQALVQQEVERVQVRDFEPLYFSITDPFEVFFDPLCSNLLNKYRIVFRFVSYQTNVGSIAFVSGPRVRQQQQLYTCHIMPRSPISGIELHSSE